jgi:N-acetylglutamate synthase-like GNAT family acetyltransferase
MNGEYEIHSIEIVPYEDKYKLDFERLNREWIVEFFKIEDEDLHILKHPESYVIAKGGQIFFAVLSQEVVGTAAMIPTSDKVFELAKMAVRKDIQGRGVGKSLLKKCISFAKERKAPEIFLLTNDILKPALNLYLSCGFVLNDKYDDERYEGGNTKMHLTLSQN